MNETLVDYFASSLDIALAAYHVQLEHEEAKAGQDEFTNTIGKEIDDERK